MQSSSRRLWSYRLKGALPYLVLWMIAGIMYVLLERGILGTTNFYPSTNNPYNFEVSFVSTAILSVILGLVHGLIEKSILNKLFKRRSFAAKIFFKTILYGLILFVFILILSFPLNSMALDRPLFHPEVVDAILYFMGNFVFLSVMIYMAIFTAIALFIDELMQNLGDSVVLNFFTGRYHTAREEDRVFMFLDMRSSTTIAEQLGHQQYYKLLNTYYADMTSAILETRGEVYQYVGDELVVSWRDERGLEEANCLRCYYLIEQAIKKNSAYYQKRFGLVPEFKAGMHMGRVMTGEVGEVKKELLFTGDAVNTTARIQGLCNQIGSGLLLSRELVQRLPDQDSFHFTPKGEHLLRGRDQSIELFSCSFKA